MEGVVQIYHHCDHQVGGFRFEAAPWLACLVDGLPQLRIWCEYPRTTILGVMISVGNRLYANQGWDITEGSPTGCYPDTHRLRCGDEGARGVVQPLPPPLA